MLGTLIHSLFQDTISDKNLSKQILNDKLMKLLKEPFTLRSLVYLTLTEEDLAKGAAEYIDSIILFNKKFSTDLPVQFDDSHPNLKIKINKVTDIEDLYLAPNYGLKGKIDVVMDVELTNDRNGIRRIQEATPFEIKTGKVSFSYSHQAQVLIYAIMIDNLTSLCDFGILAYLKKGVHLKYVTIDNFIRNGLLSQRNELVHYLKYLQTESPETKSNISYCNSCEHLLDCCLLGKVYEPAKLIDFQTHQPELITNTLNHLSEQQIDFFKRWLDLIYLEEKNERRKSKEYFYWNIDAYKLENEKRAIAKLELESDLSADLLYEYVFKRAESFKSLDHLPNLQFNKNSERITLSVEDECGNLERIGFVNGIIKFIDENYVTVQLDNAINERYFNKLFRLDVLSYQNFYSHLYTSILRLMENERNAEHLRKLIIEKKRPTSSQQPQLSSKMTELIKNSIKQLNAKQQEVICKSFKINDYLLINGCSSTGKTETIIQLIKILSKLKKTIIITAYTNRAVDNLLLKLKEYDDINFMRIGSLSKIHPDLLIHSEHHLIANCTSTSDIKNVYASINIFAGACFAFDYHLIFSMKLIEYCIVDEANQLCLPLSLLPLLNSQKFILAGDSNLLGAIASTPSNKSGLEQTLFELLIRRDDSFEDHYVDLNIQYGMNREIMKIANHCTYNNRLACGSGEIANAVLDLAANKFEMKVNEKNRNERTWLDYCLSNDIDLSVIFLDTDDQLIVNQSNFKMNNQFEINILIKILNQLSSSVPNYEISILSFYKDQIQSLKSLITDIECSTIDQYQGGNKDIILISCVKKDPIIDELLNDNELFNMAITRARKKLILIGSRITLECYEPFLKLFACLNVNQVIKV